MDHMLLGRNIRFDSGSALARILGIHSLLGGFRVGRKALLPFLATLFMVNMVLAAATRPCVCSINLLSGPIGYSHVQIKWSIVGAYGETASNSLERAPRNIGSPANISSYIIYVEGEGYCAKNGRTGAIDYTGFVASTVINNVIDELTNGGEILLKAGVYWLDTCITSRNRDGIILRGEGRATIIKMKGGANDDIIRLGAGGQGVDGWVIRDLAVDGNKANCPTNRDGIAIGWRDAVSCNNILLMNLYIHDCDEFGVCVSHSTEGSPVCKNVQVVNCEFVNNGWNGVTLKSNAQDCLITGNKVTGSSDVGITCYGKKNTIENNTVLDCTSNDGDSNSHVGIALEGGNNIACEENLVIGNVVCNCLEGISVQRSSLIRDNVVKGNAVHDCDYGIAIWQSAMRILVEGNDVWNCHDAEITVNGSNCTITGNSCMTTSSTVTLADYWGAISCKGSNNVIKGNKCLYDGPNIRTGILVNGGDYNIVDGNDIKRMSWSGIYLRAGADKNMVEDNLVVESAEYGIYIEGADCKENCIKNNNLEGNRAGAIWNGGTGTVLDYPSPTTVTLTTTTLTTTYLTQSSGTTVTSVSTTPITSSTTTSSTSTSHTLTSGSTSQPPTTATTSTLSSASTTASSSSTSTFSSMTTTSSFTTPTTTSTTSLSTTATSSFTTTLTKLTTTSTTTSSTRTSYASASVFTSQRFNTTTAAVLESTLYQTSTTTRFSGSVSTTYTSRTTSYATSTSLSTATLTSAETRTSVATELSKTGTSTVARMSTSIATSGNTVYADIIVQNTFIEQFVQRIISTFTYWTSELAQIVKNVFVTGTVRDTVVKVEPTVSASTLGFSLSSSGGITVTQGGSASNTIMVTLTSGTSQIVTLSASGLPSGASASFDPASGSPTFTSTCTISTSSSTPTGVYTITVTGTGGGLTRTETFTLGVNSRGEVGKTRIVLDASPKSGYVNKPVTISGVMYGSWRRIKGVVVGAPVEITTSWGFGTSVVTDDQGQFSVTTTCPSTGGTYQITAKFYEDGDLSGASETITFQVIAKIETSITISFVGNNEFTGYLTRKDTGAYLANKPVKLTVHYLSGGTWQTTTYDLQTRHDGYWNLEFLLFWNSATISFEGDETYALTSAQITR